MSIEATVGQLVITLVDFSSSMQQRHYCELEIHIAKLARTKLGDHVEHDHPGWVVREYFLAPMGASSLDFANAISVSQDFAECFLSGDHEERHRTLTHSDDVTANWRMPLQPVDYAFQPA